MTMDATQAAMLNEDWLRVARWDVRDPSGELITTLDALAKVLDTDRAAAAEQLLAMPASAAAPAELIAEADAEVAAPSGQASLLDEFADDTDKQPADEDPVAGTKGLPDFIKDKKKEGADTGDSTRKATIAAGAFVSGNFGKGKVEVVVTSGKVPGVDTDVTGTKDSPAARVRVYEKNGDDWKAGSKRVAVKTSSLKTIPPLGRAKFGKKSGDAGLVLLVASLDPARDIPAEHVRTAYERGVKSWPGEAKTVLSAGEWGLGRAQALIAKARGEAVPVEYVGDDDLLP